MEALDPRRQRGLQIAATAKITPKGSAWLVPSASGKGRYTVSPDKPHCTCPDHETRGGKCKHIIAVEYVMRRERHADGSTTFTEAITVQKTHKTYPQKWRAYNTAQTHEKDQFLELLHDLCAGVVETPRPKNGRPSLPIQDALFSACYKIYSTVSARRFMSDLRAAQAKGYIAKAPHFNSVLNYLEKPEVTPILKAMITETSLPLKSVEIDFACDSSGFTTSRFISADSGSFSFFRTACFAVSVTVSSAIAPNGNAVPTMAASNIWRTRRMVCPSNGLTIFNGLGGNKLVAFRHDGGRASSLESPAAESREEALSGELGRGC